MNLSLPIAQTARFPLSAFRSYNRAKAAATAGHAGRAFPSRERS